MFAGGYSRSAGHRSSTPPSPTLQSPFPALSRHRDLQHYPVPASSSSPTWSREQQQLRDCWDPGIPPVLIATQHPPHAARASPTPPLSQTDSMTQETCQLMDVFSVIAYRQLALRLPNLAEGFGRAVSTSNTALGLTGATQQGRPWKL